MVTTRAEVLRASGPTSGTKIKVRIGATREGKLTAAEIWMAYEAGAFPGSPFSARARTTLGPYDIRGSDGSMVQGSRGRFEKCTA